MPLSTQKSTLTPIAKNPEGTRSEVHVFKISDIPKAMDKMEWPVSAALMRHWFQGKPWATETGGMHEDVKDHTKMAPAEYIEESIVKMQWLLGHTRVIKSRDELRANWNNPAGTEQIKELIRKVFSNSAHGTYPLQFNGKASAAEAFGHANTRQITFDTFGDEINDLRGALANFNLRVTAEGLVNVFNNKISFTANKIGFYAEDSYDFHDEFGLFSQPLGFWNAEGIAPSISNAILTNYSITQSQSSLVKSSIFTPNKNINDKFLDLEGSRYFLITNKHFDKYRKAYNKGGDFRVYSDILYEEVQPITFEVLK